MLDIPVEPVLSVEPPAIVAQAVPAAQSSGAKSAGYDKLYTTCRDIDHVVVPSALGSFSPFMNELAKRLGGPPEGASIEWIKKINPKVTSLEAPRHGRVAIINAPSLHYNYIPDKNFIGKDHVSYLVEVQGHRYKVVINFWVVDVAQDFTGDPQYPNGHAECQEQNFNGSGLEGNGTSLNAFYSVGGPINAAFDSLPGDSFGQTTAQSITLDNNAAGYNWFIDYTPFLNEEFPPPASMSTFDLLSNGSQILSGWLPSDDASRTVDANGRLGWSA